MTEIFELEHRAVAGVTRASVAPGWGANVVAFGFRDAAWAGEVSGLEVVAPETLARSPTSFGVPLLAPTPGRVGRNQSGRFSYRGTEYEIEPTRHGLVRQAPWRLTASTPSTLRCETEIGPTPPDEPGRFPFHFGARHEVNLLERGLRSRVELVSLGGEAQPLNIGWHPYLRRPAGRCVVRIPARKRWVLSDDAEPTPTGEVVAPDPKLDFFAGRPLEEGEHWDDVFTDLESDDGIASCWIESDESVPLETGGERRLTVRRIVDVTTGDREGDVESTPHVQLYTPPGRQAISIEPLSSVPDAINLAGRGVEKTGLCEVSPGDRVCFEIVLRLEIV